MLQAQAFCTDGRCHEGLPIPQRVETFPFDARAVTEGGDEHASPVKPEVEFFHRPDERHTFGSINCLFRRVRPPIPGEGGQGRSEATP